MLKSCVTLLIVLVAVVCQIAVVSADKVQQFFDVQRRGGADGVDGGKKTAKEAPGWNGEGDFFLRSAKWVSKMNPSGGALVSGRGGFRPGFVSRDWRHVLAEPNFVKRSYNDY